MYLHGATQFVTKTSNNHKIPVFVILSLRRICTAVIWCCTAFCNKCNIILNPYKRKCYFSLCKGFIISIYNHQTHHNILLLSYGSFDSARFARLRSGWHSMVLCSFDAVVVKLDIFPKVWKIEVSLFRGFLYLFILSCYNGISLINENLKEKFPWVYLIFLKRK